MEGNSWRPAAGGPADSPAVDSASVDWRSQLQPDARQRIVNKIMDTLKRHLPISIPEGLSELKKIAVRFEEKIYTAATNQSDYLRKISLKMLSMESKTNGNNPPLSHPGVGNQSPADSAASLGMQPQVGTQGQPIAMPLVTQSQVRQPLLPQNLQNNSVSAALQGSSGLPPGMPSISGLNQSTITNVGQTSNLQNMSGVPQNSVNNPAGQGAPQNMYANAQRQTQGRPQQSPVMSQQQQQSQNQLIYQQQYQQHLLKQKIQHQQQSLLQSNHLHSSQQPLMQIPSSIQTGQSDIKQTQTSIMQSAQQSNLQQSQHNTVQQPMPSIMQQHSQSIGRQQQAHPTLHQTSSLQQQSTIVSQQTVLQPQQQLIGQTSNMTNMQQNQLLGQQSNVPDTQQQQRVAGQQNNLMSMQQPQQLLNQQTMSLHQQQQLGQSNMSGLHHHHQQQQQIQQQQLLGPQSGVSTMQQHQRSMHMMQQSKTVTAQQNQQPSLAVLQSQGQQSQHQSSQQLMSQIQSSPQLQQQLAMQQQSNSMQREMQQRLHSSGTMVHPQHTLEQQKQFIQSQRGLAEVSSSTSVDSTAQTGQASGVDWQEEVYQKIKSLKESYLAELNELQQKIALKFQQHEELIPAAKQSEQFEKMKNFKQLLERAIGFLQLNKCNIQIGIKDKLPLYEKQIMSFIASNRSKKIAPSQPLGHQQFQHGGHAHSMTLQHPSQASQLQQHDNHAIQAQQMSLQSSVASLQSASASSMQHGSVSLSTQANVSTTQQNMGNSLSAPNLDPMQGSSISSLQQGVMGVVQQSGVSSLQNAINVHPQTNLNSLPQNSVVPLQSNMSPLPSGSNVIQHQNLKQQQQQQEQQLIQTQQMKQQLQQRQMQQLVQQQQILQQPQMQQQLYQPKHQQAGQMPMHQLQQLHHMNDMNEVKMRQNSTIKSGLYQQHYPTGQLHNYYNQFKATSFPISSPQSLQVSSPQLSQHLSPQIEQHNLLPSHSKIGTPLQNANSPFVVPSPSTPIAPSPLLGESEKHSAVSAVTNGVNVGHQQTSLAPPQAQFLPVGTPGISASPLLTEITSPDGSQANALNAVPRSSVTQRPLDRLIKAIQSSSDQVLKSSVRDIESVVSMIDRIAGSAPGNGSRAAVGEDLVAMTKCRLQARNFISQDGSATTKKIKRHANAMPLNAVSSAGSINDSFKQSYGHNTPELDSTATSGAKMQKIEVSHALLEEIRGINQKLIDTVVSITYKEVDPIVAMGEGTVIKFSFSAISLSPNLKSHLASLHMSTIMPLRLLVPTTYPKCSPVLLDKLLVEESQEMEDLSVKAQSMFSRSLRCVPQPMSLGEMARTWDICTRKVIVEYAQRNGGGSFSSSYGAWGTCVSA